MLAVCSIYIMMLSLMANINKIKVLLGIKQVYESYGALVGKYEIFQGALHLIRSVIDSRLLALAVYLFPEQVGQAKQPIDIVDQPIGCLVSRKSEDQSRSHVNRVVNASYQQHVHHVYQTDQRYHRKPLKSYHIKLQSYHCQ
jgi:hypothetical protein